MDLKKSAQAHSQFAAVFAPLLSAQLGFPLEAVPPSEENGGNPADPGLRLPLRFQGALAGQCFLAAGASDAALLGEAASEILRGALQAMAEPLAAALFAQYGSVHIVPAEPADAPREDASLIALLTGIVEGKPVTLTLLADSELERGLSRLARVRAAAEASGYTGGNLGLVMDVELNVALRFGERRLSLREVMDLTSGSVVELDREVDEPVELILDGKVIARGEAVIVDGNYGVRVTEVLHPVVM